MASPVGKKAGGSMVGSSSVLNGTGTASPTAGRTAVLGASTRGKPLSGVGVREPWRRADATTLERARHHERIKKKVQPDPSFDLDKDGQVGVRDLFLASHFDSDRDGKLNATERAAADKALKSGISDFDYSDFCINSKLYATDKKMGTFHRILEKSLPAQQKLRNAQDTHKRLISSSRGGEFSTTAGSVTGSVPVDEHQSQQLVARRKEALKKHAENVFNAQLKRERAVNDRFAALMTNRYDYYSGGERPQTVDSAKLKKTAVGGAHFRDDWKRAAVSDGRNPVAAGMSTGSRRRRDEIYSQTFSELFGGSTAIQTQTAREAGDTKQQPSQQPLQQPSQQPQSARSASTPAASVIRDRIQRKQMVGGYAQHNYNSDVQRRTAFTATATPSASNPVPPPAAAAPAPAPVASNVSGSSAHWSTASRLAYSASPERLRPQRYATKLGVKAAAAGVTLQLRSDAPSDGAMPTALLLPAAKPVMVIPGAASNGNTLIDPVVSSSRFPTARA